MEKLVWLAEFSRIVSHCCVMVCDWQRTIWLELVIKDIRFWGVMLHKCLQIMAAKFVLIRDSNVQNFQEVKENQNTKSKTECYVPGLSNGVPRG